MASADDLAARLSGVRNRAEFGQLLTELRGLSGLSLRALADEVEELVGSRNRVGVTTLKEWCRGDRIPFPANHRQFEAMLAALGVASAEPWMATLRRLGDGTKPAGPSPYPGLRSFGPDDAELFFGRVHLTDVADKWFRRIEEDADLPRLLAVIGASGSGKSSLIHAGILPRLRNDGWAGRTVAPAVESIARAVDDLVGDEARTVLVVDQFEQLLTGEAEEPDDALAALARLAAPRQPHAVVIGIRADFYEHASRHPLLARALQESALLVGAMNTDELRDAIVRPAARAEATIAPDLVALLLREFARTGVGTLPLLSHALRETWLAGEPGRMTVADYVAAGGVDGAVEKSAEQVFDALPEESRGAARDLFLRLVHVGDDTPVTRRNAPRGELGSDLLEVAEFFVDARLLTVDGDDIAIAHEAMLTAWPRLRNWVDEAKESLVAHRRLREATAAWVSADRPDSDLARGVRLEQALALAEESSGAVTLNADERDYVTRSVAARTRDERERRRQVHRLRGLVALAAVMALIAALLAGGALRARSTAATARDQALSRQIAVTAQTLATTDASVASQLAVAAYRISPTVEARSALLNMAARPTPARYLGGSGATAIAISGSEKLLALSDGTNASVTLFVRGDSGYARSGHFVLPTGAQEIYALTLSPDERILTVGDTSASVTLWDVSNPAKPTPLGVPLKGLDGPVERIAFTPTGTEIAVAGEGRGIYRWDITDPGRPRALPLIPAAATTMAVRYSTDGSVLAYGDNSGKVVLLPARGTGREIARITAGQRRAVAVALSPDGRFVAAGTRQGDFGVWDMSKPGRPVAIELPETPFTSWVNDAAFSPDGRFLVAGSSTTVLRVWSTATWEHLIDLPHPKAITQTAFGGQGTLVSAAIDGTLRTWDLASFAPQLVDSQVDELRLTSSGREIAATTSKNLYIWPMPDRVDLGWSPAAPALQFRGDDDHVATAAVTRDGRLVAQGTYSGRVRLSRGVADGGTAVGVLTDGPLGKLVQTLEFSADDKLLAAGGDDGRTRVWDVSDPARPGRAAVLDHAPGQILRLAWHPTSRLLAIASSDSHVYLYDLTDPVQPQLRSRLAGFSAEVHTVAFSPSRPLLAAGGTDGAVLLWDVSKPEAPTRVGEQLTGPVGRLSDLEFTSSGDTLAASITDGTLWLWDVSTPARPERHAVLGPIDLGLYSLAVPADESVVLAGSGQSRVHVWSLHADTAIAQICGSTGDRITEREWSTYVPSVPFRAACG